MILTIFSTVTTQNMFPFHSIISNIMIASSSKAVGNQSSFHRSHPHLTSDARDIMIISINYVFGWGTMPTVSP
jgi:hypothetical protein